MGEYGVAAGYAESRQVTHRIRRRVSLSIIIAIPDDAAYVGLSSCFHSCPREEDVRQIFLLYFHLKKCDRSDVTDGSVQSL